MSYKLFNDKGGVKNVKHFKLIFGSGDLFEPFYNRILYSLRNNRSYTVIKKVLDYYNVSPNSQQFGFATQNLRQEISSASGLLGQIGQIVKSFVAMKKDAQRIKECLEYYEDNGKPNEVILKGIWVDLVDSKSGPASLNQAAQKLEFYVARDWFFRVNSIKEIEALDVPNNLKTFLIRKYGEYEHWKRNWKPRLEEMDKIINAQLEASIQTINLYKKWAQPLLRNIETLRMTPSPLNPDLLKISGKAYSQVELVAWHKLLLDKGGSVSFTYEPYKDAVEREIGDKGKILFHGKTVPFMPLVDIVLTLRRGTQGYMETVIDFYAKLIDKKRFEELYWDQWNKDPADEWINNLLLNKELEFGIKREEKKEEESKDESFFSFLSKPFELLKRPKKKELSEYELDKLIKSAGGEVSKDVALVYFLVKKSFGMLAELEMYF